EPGVELHVGHAEAHGGVADLRVLGDVDEVAARRELAPAGEAVAVHLRDHGLREVPDPHPAGGHVARPVAVAAGGVDGRLQARVAARELVARREALAGAAHDLHAHVRIAVALLEGVQQLPRRAWLSALRFSGRFSVTRRTCGFGSSTRTTV